MTMLPALSLRAVRPDIAVVPPAQVDTTTRTVHALVRSAARDPAVTATLDVLARVAAAPPAHPSEVPPAS